MPPRDYQEEPRPENKIREAGMVFQAVEGLENNVGSLLKTLEILIQKLHPVLESRVAPEQSENPKDNFVNTAIPSRLSPRISDSASQIFLADKRLQDVLARLEL